MLIKLIAFSRRFEVDGECFAVGGTKPLQSLPNKKRKKKD